MSHGRVVAAALALSSLLGGCGQGSSQVVVVIDADPGIRRVTEQVQITVHGRSRDGSFAATEPVLERPFVRAVGAGVEGAFDWPLVVALQPEGGDASRLFRLEAEALETGTGRPIAAVRAIGGYTKGETTMIRLTFLEGCRERLCEQEDLDIAETCRCPPDDPACAEPACLPAEMDATMPFDPAIVDRIGACYGKTCGEGETCCAGDCVPLGCDDGVACTTDYCDRGLGCQHAPDGSFCDDGVGCTDDVCDPTAGCDSNANDERCSMSGGSCDAVLGCQYPTCTSDNCVPDTPCQTATCEGDVCVRETRCAAGEVCCAGACVPMGCDDGERCTTDRCDPDLGCVNEPNSLGCDDGTFCNGEDQCGGGSCSVHAGDPCAAGSSCNESRDSCVMDDAGWDAGYDAGYDAGWDAGYDAGWDAGYDAGWDSGYDAGSYDACTMDAICYDAS